MSIRTEINIHGVKPEVAQSLAETFKTEDNTALGTEWVTLYVNENGITATELPGGAQLNFFIKKG